MSVLAASSEELLAFYASYYDSLAGPGNLSPEVCYFMYRSRSLIRLLLQGHFAKADRISLCNVGIGQGDWDLFLSFELGDRGVLTSIEIREESCAILLARLAAQKHPHELAVVNEDVNQTSAESETFDLVTAIGSTVKESGHYEWTLKSCTRLVRPGGILVYSDYPKYHSLRAFRDFAADHQLKILEEIEEPGPGLPYPTDSFYIVTAQKLDADPWGVGVEVRSGPN